MGGENHQWPNLSQIRTLKLESFMDPDSEIRERGETLLTHRNRLQNNPVVLLTKHHYLSIYT